MQVRPARERDLEALLCLEALCFQDPWTSDGVRAELEQLHCRPLVVERDGVVLGSLLAWLLGGELQINRVAVDPAMQNQGLGGLLVAAALERAQAEGADRAYLEVRADNAQALALYLRHGFGQAGLRKKYYHDDMDAVLMTRSLTIG